MTEVLNDTLQHYSFGLRMTETGVVVSVGDGIAWIRGLATVMMDELLYLEGGGTALVFMLGEELIGAILLEQREAVSSGMKVRRSSRQLSIGTGDALLGRVIDPLGQPLDGLPKPETNQSGLLDITSPPIIARDFVSEPMYTGNKIIDTLIPIGRGQRQLVIGDDGLGKSALALDAVIHQAQQDVYCIYVLIGQTRSSVAATLETLRSKQALSHTVVVVAEANELPGTRYLAPFSGCAIAEAWMRAGKNTLIIYDDLSKHAQAYRELSLLLHRPPGREAYPGDIFYLHSRLLERSTVLAPEYGGGSMTALPIVETKQGEISSYIPTNLISITDGQIYLDQKLFSAGILPAIDVTRSVSRIGGKAQHAVIKQEAGRIRLDYLQFLELEIFTRFGTKLEPAMEEKIRRGQLLRKMLLQDRLGPLPASAQRAWLIAYNEKMLDGFPLNEVPVILQTLFSCIAQSDLSLNAPRENWVETVKKCLEMGHVAAA